MIDTLVISRELRKKGFNEAQAEALAEAIHQRQDNLSTKDDITHLEQTLEGKINIVRGEINTVRGEINTVRGEIKHVEQVLGERINSVEKDLKSEIKHVEQVLGDRIKHVEQVLGERINSVEKTLGSRVTGLYWFMGIIGGLVLSQFALLLKVAEIL